MADEGTMDRDEIRAVLQAKIKAAWPKYVDNPVLARAVELGSNDDLRRYLAQAELLRDTRPEKRKEWHEPSPRIPADEAELMRLVLMTRTGNELPPHHYVLACDEIHAYDGPAWVPFNLWGQFKYEGRGPLVSQCARELIESAGAEALWAAIAKKYPRPDWISVNLAVVCADAKANWQAMPRDTPSDFKEGRENLARRAEQLAIELERFYLPRDPDECELPGLLDFAELMTQEELDRFDQAIRLAAMRIANRARKQAGVCGMDWDEYNDIGKEARALGYQTADLHTPARQDATEIYQLLQKDHTNYNNDHWYGGVPTLPDMMRRIAQKFREDGDMPPLTRPNLANAERNFFTRFLCKYFWTSFGDVSPAIVRDIVSMFYPQGIGENDVSQVVAQVKRSYPLSSDPENTPTK